MRTITTKGLVLRTAETGESDLRLTLLCKEHGRLSVCARGARKPKSRFRAASQLFTYGTFRLAEGAGFYSLCAAEVIEPFTSLAEDYERLCRGQYVLELCEKTTPYGAPNDDLLQLAIKTLQRLCKGDACTQTAHVFLLLFLRANGVAPEARRCAVCGTTELVGRLCTAEGLCCLDCRAHTPGEKMPLSEAGLAALQFVLQHEPPAAFRFHAAESVVTELGRVGQLCFRAHFRVQLRTPFSAMHQKCKIIRPNCKTNPF